MHFAYQSLLFIALSYTAASYLKLDQSKSKSEGNKSVMPMMSTGKVQNNPGTEKLKKVTA